MAVYSKAVAERVIRILQASGQVADADIRASLAAHGSATMVLTQLLDEGLDEGLVLMILSRTYELPTHEMSPETVSLEAVRLLPANFVIEEQILPFAIENRALNIAIVDPSRAALGNQVKALSNYNAVFFLIAPYAYRAALEYPPIRESLAETPAPQIVSTPTRPHTRPHTGRGAMGARRRVQYDVNNAGQVIEFVDDILEFATSNGCSDIHIEPYREMARIRMRIDGILQTMDMFSEYLFQNYLAVITRLKLLASCDISEKRLPQDGAMSFEDRRGNTIETRFSVIASKHGERCVIRLLSNDDARTLDNIGFGEVEFKNLVQAISAPQGMVLVTGPTGSGKTTTLYSALQWINEPTKNIMTAEDPVEYYLEGLGQVQANERIGLSFGTILRSFLRQDPEVILVGEIRDQETVEIAVKAALTGHLLLSTLHTNDAIATINRLTNMGVPDFMVGAALSLIVAQRLARCNCMHCLGADDAATPQVLTHIGFSPEEAAALKLKKGRGCEACNQSGYSGRQGVYEVLRITPEIEEAILENAQAADILTRARKDGFIPLAEAGRGLLRQGILCLAEYSRIFLVH